MAARLFPALPALALSAIAFSPSAYAADPTTGPAIEGYGASFVIEDSDVALPADHEYKVVFEITAFNGAPEGVNGQLDRVARFINLHAKNGVPESNIHAAVVLHGAALINALDDSSYQTRFESANPNRELIDRLAGFGVDIYVCGQSMNFRNFAKDELADPVKYAPSALTMVHLLQEDGYTLQP